jgi:hypothetical protein
MTGRRPVTGVVYVIKSLEGRKRLAACEDLGMSTNLRLSPELESPYEVAARNLDELVRWAADNDAAGQRNEATTRFHLIDTLLTDCLAWPREEITTEDAYKGRYTDYRIGRHATQVVVEAKKEGIYFELPAEFGARTAKLATLRQLDKGVADAIDQALNYCLTRGVALAVVANGHQLIAFIGSRQDGVPPAEGRALVFSSLEDMRESFPDLWNSLSRPGIDSHYLYSRLQGQSQPPPPEKLSSQLINYPGEKNRNQLATELQILGGLFLEDIAQAPEVEAEFLEATYCSSGALSQYALVSKEILQTRYKAFFDEAGDISALPVEDKRGLSKGELSADSIAASMSRRPIILLGDVGVGKTMFVKHLVAVEAAEVFERALVLYVDFGTEPALSTEVEAYTRRSLIEQLREKYDIDIYERKFVRAVYHADLRRFEKSIYADLKDEDSIAFKKKELELLEQKIGTTDEHLRASLNHIVATHQKQVVVFLDNVDQRPLAFQDQVFLIGQGMAQGWPSTVFVSLRPETFHRSRQSGTLSAYLPRVFTIAPPRVDLVLLRRLEFARAKLEKTGSLGVLGSGVTFESTPLKAYVDALIGSLESHEPLIELIENLSGGNVRRALDFLIEFVGSGHVDSEKIVRIQNEQNGYTVPVHEFLRALIYGDGVHFDPAASPIANLFDISAPDEREHFLLPALIAYIERAGEGGDEGFVRSADIFNEGQRLGFLPSQISSALRRGLDTNLIEANPRGVAEGEPDRYRITTVGA